jgi:hypothetical protein
MRIRDTGIILSPGLGARTAGRDGIRRGAQRVVIAAGPVVRGLARRCGDVPGLRPASQFGDIAAASWTAVMAASRLPDVSEAAGVRWYRHGAQCLYATLQISFLCIFASWLAIDGIGPPVRWAPLIAGAVLSAAFAALATLPAGAGIGVTPRHIIIRAATRETTLVPWAQVAGFQAGTGVSMADSKGTVYVLTADGRRLHTLGYGSNGNSPREMWDLLRALEDERLARVPGTASTLPPQPPPERHRAAGIGAVIGLVILGALPLYFTVTGLGPSIRAARGEGTIGYFIPQQETTGRGPAWYGQFRLPDGTVLARSASIVDVPASAVHSGVPVPARDPGNAEADFPPGTQAVFPRDDPGAWHLPADLAVWAAWSYAWALVILRHWARHRRRRDHGTSPAPPQ